MLRQSRYEQSTSGFTTNLPRSTAAGTIRTHTPIYDSRVVEYLWYLQYHDSLDRFHQADLWLYPQFKRIVKEFKTRNGLGRFTFKAIDKFLRLQGALLLGGCEKRIEGEAILAPIPGQPGEMEWSVENYSSPEEAELSRKSWTEYAPPIIVVPPSGEGEHNT